MNRRHFLSSLAATAALGSPFATAQGHYPDQIIKWIVPYPAGGGTDTLARSLADSMRPALGQQIVVDNRPGAATNIGAELVARAKPDGYTIMSADNALLFFNEHLFRKLPFSPERDFTYIGAIGKFPLLLVVHPSFPAQNFKEFLAYVKANPGKASYASVGNGSPHHLAMELFKNRTGSFITHIPSLADPAVLKRFGEFGFEPLRMRPDEFKALARGEARRWAPVIRGSNVALD